VLYLTESYSYSYRLGTGTARYCRYLGCACKWLLSLLLPFVLLFLFLTDRLSHRNETHRLGRRRRRLTGSLSCQVHKSQFAIPQSSNVFRHFYSIPNAIYLNTVYLRPKPEPRLLILKPYLSLSGPPLFLLLSLPLRLPPPVPTSPPFATSSLLYHVTLDSVACYPRGRPI
jgi:hypothetical protein